MKNLFAILVFILFAGQVLVAQKVNTIVYDSRLEQEVLAGPCNRQALTEGEFGTYFNPEYNGYKPSEKYISNLKGNINSVSVVIVFGEWCGDSQEQVPRFMKIMDEAGMKASNIKLIAVNRDKDAVVEDISRYHIERVPTFIVFKDETESGRIVETPETRLEEDLWKIISKIN
jgi:thiol-disulfide isomerase/thioredoxin